MGQFSLVDHANPGKPLRAPSNEVVTYCHRQMVGVLFLLYQADQIAALRSIISTWMRRCASCIRQGLNRRRDNGSYPQLGAWTRISRGVLPVQRLNACVNALTSR
jgi:hypothetical protein